MCLRASTASSWASHRPRPQARCAAADSATPVRAAGLDDIPWPPVPEGPGRTCTRRERTTEPRGARGVSPASCRGSRVAARMQRTHDRTDRTGKAWPNLSVLSNCVSRPPTRPRTAVFLANSGPPVLRKVDPTGYVSPPARATSSAPGYVASRLRCASWAIAWRYRNAAGCSKLTWRARNKEHGAFSTPKGRPQRINAAQYFDASDITQVLEPIRSAGGQTQRYLTRDGADCEQLALVAQRRGCSCPRRFPPGPRRDRLTRRPFSTPVGIGLRMRRA